MDLHHSNIPPELQKGVHVELFQTLKDISPMSTRVSDQLMGDRTMGLASMVAFAAETCLTTSFRSAFSGRSISNSNEPFAPPRSPAGASLSYDPTSCSTAFRQIPQGAVR
eukprot:1183980-Prorocentrum_minimum.AAC.2